ncbi:hypothetical protein E4634_01900 [Mangrovimicrobium sediminis]|uniref:Sulfotransferase domain-containing protein n=1 Tax=Mangrovimicrobium sediminis TaxID=2562682 RepID=A0A4Z0M875_9GAMM|nr:sulfotransferase domain-containing protein [Haliea sp. SAOS-164]TGD75664.1 hypothetical protein E4634_01900 [Haliea sp. SAOS-164]
MISSRPGLLHRLLGALGIFQRGNSPQFMVIGAQKAGTSSLHSYLSQHPRLCGSSPKELRYFNSRRFEMHSLGRYCRDMRGPAGSIFFESTPDYLYSPQAAGRIAGAYPDIRLIVVLREPAARAYSAWNHLRELFESGGYRARARSRYRMPDNLLYEKLFIGRECFPGFRECLDVELEMIAQGEGLEPSLLRRGLYFEQLQKYWAFIPREQMLILGFRELVVQPLVALERVARFVGLEGWPEIDLDLAPRNARRYPARMAEADARFLERYYALPNAELVAAIGEIDW